MMANPTKFKEFVSADKFFTDAFKLKRGKSLSYDISYPHFLKYFRDIDSIETQHLIIGVNFTYAWMPTIFEFGSADLKMPVEILNKAKKEGELVSDELKILKKLFNNSLVGTSKLLHFISPDKFAIWDSRVYRYLKGEEAHEYRIGNCESFLLYLEFCSYLTTLSEYEKVHEVICKEVGYPMTRFRTAELVMYQNGGKKKNKENEDKIFRN